MQEKTKETAPEGVVREDAAYAEGGRAMPADQAVRAIKGAAAQSEAVLRVAAERVGEDGGRRVLGDDAASTAKALSGLPMGVLIAQPFLEAVKGQQALTNLYLESLETIAYEQGDGSGTGTRKTRTIDFELERPVQEQDGEVSKQKVAVSAPLLSLVPLPALLIDDMTVNFTMEVKTQSIEKKDDSAKVTTSAGYKGWGFNASVTGEVSSNSSRSNTNDSSAKYDITVHASQQQPTEGMAKLTALFSSTIEPIPSKSEA